MRRKSILTVILITVFLLTACGKQEEAPYTDITFDTLTNDEVSLIALGNSNVPVGQYSQEILESLGIWDQLKDKISFGSNVKEVLSQVEEGSVDCGMVYATDAVTSKGVNVIEKAPEGSLQTPVLYPAALLKEAKSAELAKIFMDYLLLDASADEFEKAGFTFVGNNTGMDNGNQTNDENQLDDEKQSDRIAGEESFDASDAVLSGSVTVFAAASLTEALTAVVENYENEYPDIEVICNFDSSGTLQTQIEAGAEADIFFSAAQKQMNALEEENLIDQSTRIDLLENEVVLIVPKE